MANHAHQDPINPELLERLAAYKLRKAKTVRINWGAAICWGIVIAAAVGLYFTVMGILSRLH